MEKQQMKKLIVFDVDGVLLNNKMGGFKDVLVILGREQEVKKIDKEYQRRKFTGPWGLEELTKLYQGFTEEELKKTTLNYCRENLMKGTKETLAGLKKRGYLIGALSSNPQFIMDAISEILGLDFSEGTQLEFKRGVATGRIFKKVDRYIKAQILKEKMNQYGFEKQDVIMVGDSLTDLPMAEVAGLFIAFNAKEEVKERADMVIEEKDLKRVIVHIEKLLSK